jgi:hypothetical protein
MAKIISSGDALIRLANAIGEYALPVPMSNARNLILLGAGSRHGPEV